MAERLVVAFLIVLMIFGASGSWWALGGASTWGDATDDVIRLCFVAWVADHFSGSMFSFSKNQRGV